MSPQSAALRPTAKQSREEGIVLWEGNPRISGREEVGIARHSPSGARVAVRTHNPERECRLYVSLCFESPRKTLDALLAG